MTDQHHTKEENATTDRMAKIEQELAALGYIAVLWHVDDVKEGRPDLTDAQCFDVLRRLEQRHDCTEGITWETIEDWAEELFPEPKTV